MTIDINETNFTVTLDLPNSPNIFPTFYTLVVVSYIENNAGLFPSHEFSKPPPVVTEDSLEESFLCNIIDKQK
jgi:hypothetical protein